MSIDLGALNWIAITVCVVVGQVFLTVWFAVLFADPWAKAYGATDKKQHTREIPGYTYAIGIGCTFLLTLGLAGVQSALSIASLGAGMICGVYVALLFAVATALPGYAFLRLWKAFFLAMGSQTALILILSSILAVWPKA